MGGLRGQLVELQCRKQADDSARLDANSLGQARCTIDVRVGQLVESAADLLEDAFITQPLQGRPRDAGRVEIASTRYAAVPNDLQGPLSMSRLFHAA
jgi:hypothetical protein